MIYSILQDLFDSADRPVTGPVGFAHQYIDMSKQTVQLNKTTNVSNNVFNL